MTQVSLIEQARRALELAVEGRSATDAVEMNVGDLCVVIGLLSGSAPSSAAVDRLAYGYELMHTALCHIAGTSGADRHWYVHKAQEVTARITRVGEVTKDSNPSKPGDCLRGYRQFAAPTDPRPSCCDT